MITFWSHGEIRVTADRVASIQDRDPSAGGRQRKQRRGLPSAPPGPYQRAQRRLQRGSRRRELRFAHQVMRASPPVLREGMLIEDAWKFLEGGGIDFAPVLGDDGRLLGMVSRDQLLRQTSFLLGASPGRGLIPVHTIMEHEIYSVAPDTTIQDVARAMLEAQVAAMPVMEGATLQGLLQRSDLLQAISNEAPVDLWV